MALGVFEQANRVVQVNRGPAVCQVVDAVTVSANGSSSSAYQVKCGDFLWCATVAQSTSTFQLRIRSDWEGANLDNDRLRSALFCGTAQAPMRHPPKFAPQNGILTFDLWDLSGSSNVVRLYLWGFKATDEDRINYGRGRGLFVHSTANAGLAISANDTKAATIDIETSANFRMSKIVSAQTSAAWLGNFEYKDVREPNKTRFGTSSMRSEAWTGPNTAPFDLPSTLVCQKGTTLDLSLADASGSTNTVHMHFIGERLPDDPAAW